MNLLIKIIYLFLVLLFGNMYIPKNFDGVAQQGMALSGLLYLAHVIYRVIVNRYFKVDESMYDIIIDGIYNTILVIVGIVVINYLITNPEILKQYGIDIPRTNRYATTFLSLMPFLATKALLSPDI